ncbi:MAG TPA: DUF2179 domain-containing protein [Bacteroidia bacterium]|nr:DUF2179 domain-containing protein [Bacteroidia bacterium]HNT80347.1 DUF2179 domain-containing protein [Bacteroidia bacterium]
MSTEFLQSDFFNWIVLPLLIFASRTIDVTLGTLRNIFVFRNLKKIAPILGFFEVLIWLIAISQIMKNLNNAACYFAWAGGYASGMIVGMYIENRLALGLQMVRIITHQPTESILDELKSRSIGLTIVDGQGSVGPVKILFTVIKRKSAKEFLAIIQKHLPDAFFSIEDVREAGHGSLNPDVSFTGRSSFPIRKGK